MKRRVLSTICALGAMASAVAADPSPYISRVYDFCPAPGQNVNSVPTYEEGDTRETMRAKVEECLANNNQTVVTLGGYGGYVIFGFDHLVENKSGMMDFRILGNAFYSTSNPDADGSREGGSCEPGVVMVSYDANGNGLPDDPWYELAGSEYNSTQTTHNYRITYYRPDENKEKTKLDNFVNDDTYIRWTDNLGREGYVYRNIFHTQSYYPQWIEDDELEFEGTLLADNYIDESGTGEYYVQYAYSWGYADNHPNTDSRSAFNIAWAVDENGNSVDLPGVHFVKVYTAVNQNCGWLGESSTEIQGACDLHLLGESIADTYAGIASVTVDDPSAEECYYTLDGIQISEPTTPGVYIHRSASGVRKVLIR